SRSEARAANIERGRVLASFDRLASAEEALWPQHRAHADDRSEWALMELYARHPCDLTLRDVDAPVASMAIARDESVFYFGDHSGTLSRYDAASGARTGRWNAVEGGLTAIVEANAPKLVLGSGTGLIVGFDLDRGSRSWERHTGEDGRALIAM